MGSFICNSLYMGLLLTLILVEDRFPRTILLMSHTKQLNILYFASERIKSRKDDGLGSNNDK